MDTTTSYKLTAKQEAFCIYYYATHHGTNSALRAGYSPDSAYSIAEENLNKPEIQRRLAELESHHTPSEAQAHATVEERRAILASIARGRHQAPATAGHRITAIAELNKMGGDYAPERHIIASKVVFEVVYRGAPEAALSPLATPDGPVIEAGSTPRICESNDTDKPCLDTN